MMNNYSDFIELLRNKLKYPLPGMQAQFLMEPITRKIELKKQTYKAHPKESSILILLYPKNHKLCTVMIKRPEYDGVHSGQIAFPGGRKEKEDTDLIDTALRESFEEVGIKPDSVDILGSISELYIPPSNFNVLPVIGFSKERPKFRIDKIEVAKVLEIEINEFLNSGNIQEKKILSRRNMRLNVPCYYIQNEIIWGASAMILSEFCEIIKQLEP